MNRGLANVLAALLFLGVLTCWAPGYWTVALVEAGAFALLGWVIVTRRLTDAGLALCALAAVVGWGIGQFTGGVTVYCFETGKAVLYWAACTSIFIAARVACGVSATRNHLLRCLLWFGTLVSVFVVVEYITSQGKVFW